VLEFVASHRGASAPGTRRKALAIFASFFGWAQRWDRIVSNPMGKIDRPRRRSVERHAHSLTKVKAIVAAQPQLRDRVAMGLLAQLGLRKNEVRLLSRRDIDLQRGEMRVHGKGGKISEVPIVYAELLADLARLSLESRAEPDEYLLFPVRVGNARTKPRLRGVVREHRDRPMQPSTMHRWFKRCLLQAGAADFPMHELRHTAGNEFRRATGDLELTRLFMRHASISTTSEHYMHADKDELIAGMRLAEERWKMSDFGKSPQFAGKRGAERTRTAVVRLRFVRAGSFRGACGASGDPASTQRWRHRLGRGRRAGGRLEKAPHPTFGVVPLKMESRMGLIALLGL
jgi:integrase/recombinase XerC